jgi:hypothetical protein
MLKWNVVSFIPSVQSQHFDFHCYEIIIYFKHIPQNDMFFFYKLGY